MRGLSPSHLLLLFCFVIITRLSCSESGEIVTVMYRKRMQHLAEMNYVGILSIKHILDVGASDGYWTKFASTLFPSAEFFQIEGNPYLHKVLQETGIDFEISVVGADTEKGRPVSFNVKPKPATEERFIFNTEHTGDAADANADLAEELTLSQSRMTTIDDIAARRGLAPFQLLRLNLQGGEFEALQGASRTLQAVEFVLLEVPVHQYHPGAASFQDLDGFLARRGFRMYDIMDLRYSQPRTDLDVHYQVPTLVQYDVLWAREDSKVFSGVCLYRYVSVCMSVCM